MPFLILLPPSWLLLLLSFWIMTHCQHVIPVQYRDFLSRGFKPNFFTPWGIFLHLYIYMCVCVNIYVCVSIYIHICTYVRTYVRTDGRTDGWMDGLSVCRCRCRCRCRCVCVCNTISIISSIMYVCMCIYITIRRDIHPGWNYLTMPYLQPFNRPGAWNQRAPIFGRILAKRPKDLLRGIETWVNGVPWKMGILRKNVLYSCYFKKKNITS